MTTQATRHITGTFAHAALPDAPQMAYALEIGYEVPLRLWNGDGDVTIEGLTGTFIASQALAVMPATDTGFAGDKVRMGIELAVVDQAIIAALSTRAHANVPVRLWCLLGDGTGAWRCAIRARSAARLPTARRSRCSPGRWTG